MNKNISEEYPKELPMGDCVIEAKKLLIKTGIKGRIMVFRMIEANHIKQKVCPVVNFKKLFNGNKLNNHVFITVQDKVYDPLWQKDTIQGLSFKNYITYLIENHINIKDIKSKYLIFEGHCIHKEDLDRDESKFHADEILEIYYPIEIKKIEKN